MDRKVTLYGGGRGNPLFAIPLVILLIISALSMKPNLWPLDSGNKSNDEGVTKVETETESGVRIDYVDADGKVITVSDKKYATVVKTMDENGHCVRVEYYDENGKPVLCNEGYAVVCYTYNEKGQKEKELYFGTDGEPAQKNGSYYGIYNVYEEGNAVAVYFLGADGEPAPNRSGCVIKRREYNADKKVTAEYYLDAEGRSVALATGESGVLKDYDSEGRETEITYVDGSGAPVKTTRGYATERKSYNANGKLALSMYYDAQGDYAVLKNGYSGVRYENGKKIYIRADGREVFDLSGFLYKSFWAVCLIGVALCLVIVRGGKKVNTLLLILYLAFIFYMTLMYREVGTGRLNLELFWSYKTFLTNEGLRREILNNIWLFVPLGAILYRLVPRPWILILPILLSFFIEGAQYVWDIGLFELDDIVSNSLGALIGYLMSRSFGPPGGRGLFGSGAARR